MAVDIHIYFLKIQGLGENRRIPLGLVLVNFFAYHVSFSIVHAPVFPCSTWLQIKPPMIRLWMCENAVTSTLHCSFHVIEPVNDDANDWRENIMT